MFQHDPDDTFSLPENNITSLYCDASGDIWVLLSKGIYRYDYLSTHFIFQPGSDAFVAAKMLEGDDGLKYLATNKGLVQFDSRVGAFQFLSREPGDQGSVSTDKAVIDFCQGPDGDFYLTTKAGLKMWHLKTHSFEPITVSFLANKDILSVACDHKGFIWLYVEDQGPVIWRTDIHFHQFKAYTQFRGRHNDFADNRINSILVDAKDNFWVATIRQGIFLYNTPTDRFVQFQHDPMRSMSLSADFITSMYQDREGFIWMGTAGYGADYFHPGRNLFHTLQPSFNQAPTLPENWCRAADQDLDGNLWLGTSGGIAKYDVQKGEYMVFQNTSAHPNVLYANSIRSVLCDGDEVWIGGNGGLNRYNRRTGKMDFFGENDSIPSSFFWTILKDHKGNIWFGSREGLYKYNTSTMGTEDIRRDSLLAPYSRKNVLCLFEDSHDRLWISFYSGGLIMYDPSGPLLKSFSDNSEESTSLPGGGILSIAEDKSGVIWMGTLLGLHAYNPATRRFSTYHNSESNQTDIISALLFDDRDRLWMASSRGLYMLDKTRRVFKSFDIADGLPTVDFNNHSALRMKNGKFLYPTLKGFVWFDPEEYTDTKDSINVYLSSFKIFGKEYKASSGIEQMDEVRLDYHQNFFSIELTALNYLNPKQNWYAHKLEPFDKDWIYARERTISYTNVPGGDYVFHYKTSTSMSHWGDEDKTLRIHLETIFYKTWWFRLLVIGLFISVFWWVYSVRLGQKEKMLALQTKAHSLEREKVLVMYENLKQQLNPHFLFNSLTSLGSLISTNPASAKQFLERMSKIYRYILQSRDNETVPLADEVRLAEIYTQLQQTRFKEGLQLHIAVPEEFHHRRIAPVTLQNLIENAIKHNVIDASTPLVIEIFVENEWLVVRNNLQKKNFVETSNRQGLSNMQSLYHYLSGREIDMRQDEHYFTVKIPLL